MQPRNSASVKSFVPPAFTPRRRTLDRRRVAVLPMRNLSPDPNDEYFADGLTEELISTISNISGLSVISNTSVMQYKKPNKKLVEIGEDLGAGTILEGSVRKAGNKIRVAVQLIEVKEDKHLWVQNYDRELKDVFQVQSEIAERVAKALEVKVFGEETLRLEGRGSKNAEAVALYMKGTAAYNEDAESAVCRAIQYFEKATQEDSNFALAYVGLADCYYWLEGWHISHVEGVARAKENLNRALALNPNLAEAHARLASWLHNELRWEEAEAEFGKALELSPSDAETHSRYAGLLMYVGKLDEALVEARRAQNLDPLLPETILRVGNVFYYRREYDQAIERYEQVLRMKPNFSQPMWWMAMAYSAKSMTDKALEWILKYTEHIGFLPSSPGYAKVMIARFYAVAGRMEEAKVMFNEAVNLAPDDSTRKWLALWYVALGNIDVAFQYLDRAFEARDYFLVDIKVEPAYDSIRPDPRYSALLAKLHLS